MTIIDLKEHWLRTATAVGFAVAVGFGAPVYAQDEAPAEEPAAEEEQPAAEEVVEEAEAEAAREDTIVVTGSRIRRDEFSSASPIQVIDGQVSRELGIFDTARLLQESTVATGVQIDTTFTGFVLDNGPGASTVALRGIDPERTLIMINGRRLGNGGVEGAPTAPDLNLIPSSLIARIDVLLDGASPVYGSDAIAGVANIILRDDLEGFTAEAAFSFPETGGGETLQASATWGVSNDRGYIAAAAEYYRREQMSVADRDLLCNRHVEIDENGKIRHDEVDVRPGTEINPCTTQIIGRFRNLFGSGDPEFVGRHSDYFFTPGTTNIGMPNYSDEFDFSCGSFTAPGVLVPHDGHFHRGCTDGLLDVNVKDPIYNGADYRRSIVQNQDFISPLERLTFTAFGNYRIESLNDMETFFELSYANRKNKILSSGAQIFPTVPETNPFNPCGNDALDSGATAFNACGTGDFGIPVVPIVLIEGDRNNTEVELSQIRIVGGVRGPLPFWNEGPGDGIFGFDKWAYEVSGSYHRSFGTSVRRGIIEDRLRLSLWTTVLDGDDNPVCGIDNPNFLGFDLFGFLDPVECVPVNLFSESVQLDNKLTPEEEEFLFGVRTFSTEIEQSIVTGFVGGNIMNLPAGSVGFVIGGEYRRDEIDSRPDDNAEDGNFIGFFADRGAVGARELKEGFAEIRIPVLKDLPLVHDLWVEASGRVTNETFYGTNWTYGVKGLYQPVEWLTFRGSYGTSFRAPNLREQFFRGSTGFASGFNDPCVVPQTANDGGVYDPAGDDRDPQVIANCQLAGADPFSLGLTGVPSIEVLTGGTTDLFAETSTTYTVGAVLEVPYSKIGLGSDFTTQLSVTHFNIDVRDSIEEPTLVFLFSDCYNSTNLSSAFCGRITRDPGSGFVDLVDAGFINIGQITSVGFDFNALLGYEGIKLGEHALDLSLDVRATWLLEQTEQIIDDFDDNLGEIGVPKWRAQATLFADWWDLRLLWRTRFIDSMEQDPEFRDSFSNADTCRPFINTSTGQVFQRDEFGDLILDEEDDPIVESVVTRDLSDVQCRDVGRVDAYWLNDVSLTMRRDTWSITAGINNVFDVDPPIADSSEVLVSAAGNFPLGVGYDFFGRTFFVNVAKKF